MSQRLGRMSGDLSKRSRTGTLLLKVYFSFFTVFLKSNQLIEVALDCSVACVYL